MPRPCEVRPFVCYSDFHGGCGSPIRDGGTLTVILEASQQPIPPLEYVRGMRARIQLACELVAARHRASGTYQI